MAEVVFPGSGTKTISADNIGRSELWYELPTSIDQFVIPWVSLHSGVSRDSFVVALVHSGSGT